MIKRIVRPNIVNPVVEGSYYQFKCKGAINFIVQIVAIAEHNYTENFKEVRSKKISLGNNSDMRDHILNQSRTLTYKKVFAEWKFFPAFFENIPSFVCLVLKIENEWILKLQNFFS